MRRASKTLYAAGVAALMLGGLMSASSFAPAFAQDALTPEAMTKDQPPAQCIFFSRLYDWTPINNTNLILWASRTQSYHVQLTPPCQGLRFATGVGFFSRSGSARRLCTLDSVIVDNGPGIPERCQIQEMIELDDAALKALLAQAPGRPEGRP
ncbi:MAG: DUF6491 family protein [Proteobacteria bacterium]|nr:DUF6491 family protein [Pseudomonadota bacterium]